MIWGSFTKGRIVMAPKWQILWDVPGMHWLVSIESDPRMTTGKTATGSWVPTVYWCSRSAHADSCALLKAHIKDIWASEWTMKQRKKVALHIISLPRLLSYFHSKNRMHRSIYYPGIIYIFYLSRSGKKAEGNPRWPQVKDEVHPGPEIPKFRPQF